MKNIFAAAFTMRFWVILFLSLLPVTLGAQNKAEKLYTGLVIESQEELDAQETGLDISVRGGGKSLPGSFDLSSKMPPVGSQGSQGSCTAWSTTYYVKSYHEMVKNGWSYGWGNYNPFYSSGLIDPSKGTHVFSPAWTYNQINGGRDNGSSIANAFKLLVQKGGVPWSVMPYNHKDYKTQPTQSMKNLAASKYRSKRYSRVITTDPANIKREIASGNPVVGGFNVTSKWYKPSQSVRNGGVFDDYTGSVTGGHAMAIVGYDDSKVSPSGHKGAFKIINSWGNTWGNRGFFWMSYKCAAMLCKYAYVLYDSEGQVIPSGGGNDGTLNAPAGVSASRGTYSDRIFISWDRVDNAVSYIIERSTGDSKNFSRVAVVNVNSYTDRNVQSDYRYNYRIIALSGQKRSDAELSPVAEGFALKRNTNIPEQITNLNGVPSYSGSNVRLTWNSVPGTDYYRIIRYDQVNRKWKDIGRSKGNSFSDGSPNRRIPNYYYVAAVNSAGQGKWSNLFRVNVAAGSGPPSVVSGVSATQGKYSDRVVISWDRQPAAEYYLIYRWNKSARKWDFNTTVTGVNYTDSSYEVKNGDEFLYTVKAYNRYGSSDKWSAYSPGFAAGGTNIVSLRSGVGVETPENFAVRIDENSGEVNLSWKKGNGLAEYRVYRKKEGSGDFELVKSLARGTVAFSEKFPGSEGDIYFYRVAAVMMGNESPKTSPLAVTMSEFKPTVMTTFVPGEGLRNFRGIWKAQYLTSDGKAVSMEIKIVDNGNRYKAEIKYGNRVKSLEGTYASKSRYLEGGKFSFRMLPAFDNDVANVVIPENVFMKSRIELNFARENQDLK